LQPFLKKHGSSHYIFGAILSGMVYFYEKRGTISMKWRLVTSITLIITLHANVPIKTFVRNMIR
jgi:hypothetical protein